MQIASYEDIKLISPVIKIRKYIIDLTLPKCNLVFGKAFSSVYLQLLINTNNDPNTKAWKKDKCWLGIDTIAKNINCNSRTVSCVLKYMGEIGLIEKSYHQKLYMFALKENKLTDANEIKKNNFQIEQKLLTYLKGKEKEKAANKFIELNNMCLQKPGNYEFKDLNILRYLLKLSEQVKHGSSLMFIMFFANNFINSNIDESQLQNLSEQQRAIRLGCSQSTISRYLKSFKECKYITTIEEDNKIPNKILINKELLVMSEASVIENIKKEVFKCPVCNKEVESIKKLNTHIIRCKDQLHSMFKDLQEENDIYTMEGIDLLYEDNKHKFDAITGEKDEAKQKINTLSLQLVKYFYGITNTRCPSWAKETNLIKSHLNHDMEADEVMEVMRYMAKRAYQDLRFFNNSINEALVIRQCKLEVNKEGTDAFLVKLYYKGMKQSITDRLMLQSIKKLNELRANGYDYVQIKTIVEYMVEKKCPNFNFIVNMANEAMTKSKDKNEMTKAYTTEELVKVSLDGIFEYGIIMMKDSDYDMAKKEIIMKLKEDLCAGKVNLTKVNKTYHKFAVALAKEIYRRNMYDTQLTPQQWMNKIQLNEVNLEQAIF